MSQSLWNDKQDLCNINPRRHGSRTCTIFRKVAKYAFTIICLFVNYFIVHFLNPYKNENLLISKRQYFTHDFTNVLIDCIHFYGVKYLIHVDSCNASVDYIVTADPLAMSAESLFAQIGFIDHKQNLW